MRLLVDAVDEMVPLPPVLDVLETQLIAEVRAACKGQLCTQQFIFYFIQRYPPCKDDNVRFTMCY